MQTDSDEFDTFSYRCLHHGLLSLLSGHPTRFTVYEIISRTLFYIKRIIPCLTLVDDEFGVLDHAGDVVVNPFGIHPLFRAYFDPLHQNAEVEVIPHRVAAKT